VKPQLEINNREARLHVNAADVVLIPGTFTVANRSGLNVKKI